MASVVNRNPGCAARPGANDCQVSNVAPQNLPILRNTLKLRCENTSSSFGVYDIRYLRLNNGWHPSGIRSLPSLICEDIPIILCSGFREADVTKRLAGSRGVRIVPKPIERGALIATVRQIVDVRVGRG
jgi:hypothetical protein